MTAQELRDDKIRNLVETYRDQGYEVVIDPSPDAIPGFDSSLKPNLLAKKGRDQVVIEVKSRNGLRNSDAVRRMADALARQPDWRFELVVLEDAAIEPNQTASVTAIATQLSSADYLLHQNQVTSAFALAWIGVEAALRKIAGVHHLESEDTSPIRLIRELLFHGILERKDFDLLSEKFQVRNQIVHGFVAPTLSTQDVGQLLELAKRLIASCENETAAA